MTFIRKKVWPYYFQLMIDGKKNTDLRLADFEIEVGDTIIFQEYDPNSKGYTGREYPRIVVNVNHVNLDKFHTLDEIKEFGHFIIEHKTNVIY